MATKKSEWFRGRDIKRNYEFLGHRNVLYQCNHFREMTMNVQEKGYINVHFAVLYLRNCIPHFTIISS